jgi:hypothetical protein
LQLLIMRMVIVLCLLLLPFVLGQPVPVATDNCLNMSANGNACV